MLLYQLFKVLPIVHTSRLMDSNYIEQLQTFLTKYALIW